jgi:hypothetical protein
MRRVRAGPRKDARLLERENSDAERFLPARAQRLSARAEMMIKGRFGVGDRY